MHKLRLQLFLFFICSVKCSLLHGMLSVESAENKYVLWSTIITNLPRDAYDTHRTLALVNKAHNKIIEEHHRQDKKCIEKLMLQRGTLIIPEQVWWNKDFSKCAWVTTIEPKWNVLDPKKLELTLVGLDTNKDIIIRKGMYGGYKFPVIDDQICPFFDKEGGIFCYGIGDIKSIFGYNNDVIEYSLNFAGKIENKICSIEIPHTVNGVYDGFNPLCLMQFPILLKVFLLSTQLRKPVGSRTGYKSYMIDGLIIPENYKIFKKHALWGDRAVQSSYDDLPYTLRGPIDKQYAEQQREKNNQTSLEK